MQYMQLETESGGTRRRGGRRRKAAGLWLVVGPQIDFGGCNLTPTSCNDSPGGRNDFLHWCCYC